MEERNLRKTRVGKVVSDKMDKTIVVAIEDNAGAVQQRDVAVDLDFLFLISSSLPYLNGSREASRR